VITLRKLQLSEFAVTVEMTAHIFCEQMANSLSVCLSMTAGYTTVIHISTASAQFLVQSCRVVLDSCYYVVCGRAISAGWVTSVSAVSSDTLSALQLDLVCLLYQHLIHLFLLNTCIDCYTCTLSVDCF